MIAELIEHICTRYIELRGENHAPGQTLQMLFLTLECLDDAVPLDLAMFALATDAQLIAEIDGIWAHFDTKTGKLAPEAETGFWPRYAIEHQCGGGSCGH